MAKTRSGDIDLDAAMDDFIDAVVKEARTEGEKSGRSADRAEYIKLQRTKARSQARQRGAERKVERERIAQRQATQQQRNRQAAQKQALAEAKFQNQQAQQRRRSTPAVSAPSTTVSSGEGSGLTPFAVDRQTTSRIILVIIVFCALAAAVADKSSPAINEMTVDGQVVRIPAHLRSIGSVLIMGTVSLVVNEIDAGVGLLLGFGLLFWSSKNIAALLNAGSSFIAGPKVNAAGVGNANQGRNNAGTGGVAAGPGGQPIAYNPGVGGSVGVNPNP